MAFLHRCSVSSRFSRRPLTNKHLSLLALPQRPLDIATPQPRSRAHTPHGRAGVMSQQPASFQSPPSGSASSLMVNASAPECRFISSPSFSSFPSFLFFFFFLDCACFSVLQIGRPPQSVRAPPLPSLCAFPRSLQWLVVALFNQILCGA